MLRCCCVAADDAGADLGADAVADRGLGVRWRSCWRCRGGVPNIDLRRFCLYSILVRTSFF
jgi:hypothetical protein